MKRMVRSRNEPGEPTGAPATGAVNGEVRQPVMEVRHVRKAYEPGTWAVDDISLEVYDGEILALLGPSGCGKTTTLRLMAGLERCDEGTIRLGGKVLDAAEAAAFVPTNRRRIGMVFQSYAIWPHMTVWENVEFGVRLRSNRRDRPKDEVAAAVDQALERVGMSEYASRQATALSGGQQQRVAVARALAYQPRLLLMDEPFSNLDANRRESMRAELKLLQRELGIPTVFVTHDQEEALSVADRIAVMDHGKIDQIGDSVELYRRPASVHVRDFLGRSILIKGTVSTPATESEARTLHIGDWELRGVPADTREGLAPDHTGDGVASIRPESVVVEPFGIQDEDRPHRPNTYRCRLLTTLFMGDHYQASVELPWGQRAMLMLSPDESWSEGQELLVTLPSSKVKLWPA